MEPCKDQLEKTYCVKCKNNSSKRWDGKTVMIDEESLYSVCNTSEVHLLYKDEMVSVRHAAYSVISACSPLNFVSVIAETSGISKFVFINF